MEEELIASFCIRAADAPTLDAAAFPDTVKDYHWSASRPRHSDTLGYSAYFGQGETVTAALSGSGAHVRCVAGAIAVGEPWVVEDGEVRMPSLALAWSQAPLETRSHGEAEAACAAEGMRLPTLNELQAIVDEARRRGIEITIDDAEAGLFTLTQGGRKVRCRESLSDLTSAVSMTLCQDKSLTHRTLARAGLKLPAQQIAGSVEENAAFLEQHGSVVVKPLDGEQGQGVSVDLRSSQDVEEAIARARQFDQRVLLESFHPGLDLRIVVIGYEVVAAAIRRPAEVVGDGSHSIRQLIETQSRRRQAATAGESRIPMDEETQRCISDAGFDYDSVLPRGERLAVRRTANLHTGGTLDDVTDQLHPELIDAAVRAARALDIPVVGLDLLVPAADQPEYVFIEANERVGLANHHPQPTAERFVDLLFPLSYGTH